MRRVAYPLLAAVAVGTPLACGGAETTPRPAAPVPAVSAALVSPPAPASASTAPAPLASVFTTDPSAVATLLAAAAAAAPAWLGPVATTNADATESGLRAAAAQYAPGMTPEGEVAKATLTEGSHVSFVANLDNTKCYAIVAYGPALKDLDVNLLLPPFYNLLAGQDGMTGGTAVIGASPAFMCPLVPMSFAYKVDVYAKKGAGPIAAQVYSKAR